MSNIKFVRNHAGVRELLKSPGIQGALIASAGRIRDRAGSDYDVYIGANRANVSVRTGSAAAERDNLRNNTLLKAIGGKR